MSLPWGVYVHVPWCRVQCPYCAFEVTTGADAPDSAPWLGALRAEWASQRPFFPDPSPATLYLGGGTPSRLPPEAIATLVDLVGAQGEVAMEANPEDLDDAWLEGARQAGVHRLSVGVQSFSERLRRRLGRAWVAAEPRPVLERVARAGFRSWSLDLIFAVPGQTLDDLDQDLDAIEALGAPHVALYGLTFEPGTPFGRAHERGRLPEVDDGTWRRFYDHLVDRLEAMGLERYEVSNFARPGHRSAHNELYWSDRPYMGLGPSAHGYRPDGLRTMNAPSLPAWLADPTTPAHVESPDAEQRLGDLLVSGLRGVDGVELGHLEARTGLRLDAATIGRLAPLLLLDGTRLRLARDGVPLCDAIVARLLDSAGPLPGQ